ncbi:hypothetical protein [Actinomadura sediminis]|uniref:Uncharacterized protein n=1 Tax=Actinomadura sediminis TaxID=1038904 RepID=A0ABW3F2Y4_9ACTN
MTDPASPAASAPRSGARRLPGLPAPRPRRRTVRRAPAPRPVPSPRVRPSAWTLYARWEWHRATRRS